MDDFYSDDFEGALDYDLHRDLELEEGNDYDNGPLFDAPAFDLDLDLSLDVLNSDIEYHSDSEHNSASGGIGFQVEYDVSDINTDIDPYHDIDHYESSEPDSVDEASGLQSSSEDTDSEDNHPVSESEAGSVSTDDSGQDIEIHQHLGPDFRIYSPVSDSGEDEDEDEDEEDLEAGGDELSVDHSALAGADSEEEEIYYPEVEGVHNYSADEESIQLSSDYSEDDDIDDNSVQLHNHSLGHLSDSPELSSDELESSDRSSSPSSHSEDSLSLPPDSISDGSVLDGPAPEPPGPGSSPEYTRRFNHYLDLADRVRYFRDQTRQVRRDNQRLHQRRVRVDEELNALRERARLRARFGGQEASPEILAHAPHPFAPNEPRRADAQNGVEYFLDQLPGPQRNIHGQLADMEMEVERARHSRRRAAPAPLAAPPRPQQQRQPTFIDLTEEPDSPPREILALPDAPPFAARHRQSGSGVNQHQHNPRRPPIAIRRTPSLARSDGSFLGPGGAPVIDLTDDAPEVQPRARGPRDLPPRAARQREQVGHGWVTRPNMNRFFRQIGLQGNNAIDFLAQMQVYVGAANRHAYHEVEFMGENPLPGGHGAPAGLIMENPLFDNPVDFNYGANGLDGPAPRPKPVHISPPEARAGFTRATGEDTVAVCPSCDEELRYNPEDQESQPPPAKKARHTKKDREEHHFWAVKACGHVYCRSCYDNRRPTAKNPVETGFRTLERKVLCAVDECTSDVSNKTAWVGIFL